MGRRAGDQRQTARPQEHNEDDNDEPCPPPLTARQLAELLNNLAAQETSSLTIQMIVPQLQGPSLADRILNAWRWLPTRYAPDGPMDTAQSPVFTFWRGLGDCEDEAGLLACMLKALYVDARVGVMPGHAAVFVRLYRAQENAHPLTRLPPGWPCIEHKRRLWLPLESTVAQKRRVLPGQDADLVRPWVNTDFLQIAGT